MSTSYSLAKAQSCQNFNQNLVLLFVFSFNSFVQAKFGAFVRIFISHLCLKYLSAILFVLGKSLIVVQYIVQYIMYVLEVTIARKVLPHPQGMAACAIC
jgi:hypothetical protein